MSIVKFQPVARGLKSRPVVLPSLGGDRDRSNWEQPGELPYTEFYTYSSQPLYHQIKIDTFDGRDKEIVAHLSALEQESITPFEKSGDFAAGPLSSKWPLDSIWDTGRQIQGEVHYYIAERVQKIFADLAKHNVRVSSKPYDNLEIWYKDDKYVLRYRPSLLEDGTEELEPNEAKQQVFKKCADRAKQRHEDCRPYDDKTRQPVDKKLAGSGWTKTMREVHMIRHTLMIPC